MPICTLSSHYNVTLQPSNKIPPALPISDPANVRDTSNQEQWPSKPYVWFKPPPPHLREEKCPSLQGEIPLLHQRIFCWVGKYLFYFLFTLFFVVYLWTAHYSPKHLITSGICFFYDAWWEFYDNLGIKRKASQLTLLSTVWGAPGRTCCLHSLPRAWGQLHHMIRTQGRATANACNFLSVLFSLQSQWVWTQSLGIWQTQMKIPALHLPHCDLGASHFTLLCACSLTCELPSSRHWQG